MKTVNQIKAKASYVSPSYKAVELSPRAHYLQSGSFEEEPTPTTGFSSTGAGTGAYKKYDTGY